MFKLLTILIPIILGILGFKVSARRLAKKLEGQSSPMKDPIIEALVKKLAQHLELPRIDVYVLEDLNLNGLFFKNLHKIGYRYLNFKERRKKTFLIKAFQRHFVQQKVSGVIDKKTYIISHFLAKNS